MNRFRGLVGGEARRQRRHFVRAALLASLVAAASVLLLGLSGWFITAAALAGATGTATAVAFNYMLPSAAIRLLAIMRTGARYGEALASHTAALGVVAGVRPAIFRGITALPARQALELATGEATARVVNDLSALEHDLVRQSAQPAAAAALITGLALVIFGGIMAAITLAVVFVGVLLLAHRVARPLRLHAAELQAANGALKDLLGQLIESAPELRCYGLEAWAGEEITRQADPLARAQIACADAHARLSLLHVIGAGMAATLVFAVSVPSGAPIAAMAALAAAMTLDGLGPLLRRVAGSAEVASAEKRLDALLAAQEDIPAAPILLHQPSLTLDAHEPLAHGGTLALTGASGSGKTTLIETLAGLRPARHGTVWLDGIDIAYLSPQTLRAVFAWVPQDATLVAGTVRDNLRLGNPGASEAALWDALADAALDVRIRALPQGLDSWVGENGERLSGGERRRLALARAYLRTAPWLLLDEPTESLDGATEQQVVDRLAQRLRRTGQGLVLASHRRLPHRLCTRTRPAEPAWAMHAPR